MIKFRKHAFTLNEEKPKKSSLNEMEVELKGGTGENSNKCK